MNNPILPESWRYSLQLCFSGLWCLIAIKHLPLLECALPFLYINMSRKCHVWEQGYQTLGKHQNQGTPDHRGSAKWRLAGQPQWTVKTILLCSSWEVLNEQAECNLSRSICGCLSLLNLIPKLHGQSKCDKQAAKWIITKTLLFLIQVSFVFGVQRWKLSITSSISSSGWYQIPLVDFYDGLQLKWFK